MDAPREPLTVVGIYPWSTFWSMGEGRGSPSFFLSPKGFVNAGHRMIIVHPRGDNPVGWADYHGIELYRYSGGPKSVIDDPSRNRLVRPVVKHGTYWWYQVAAYRAGARIIAETKPDVLIAYGNYSTPCTWLLGRRFGLPTVNRLFGTYLSPSIDGGLVGRLKLLRHYIPTLGLSVPANYTILCDDGSEGNRVAAALGVPTSRLRFWRNGASHEGYDPDADVASLRRRLSLPVDGILLFTISRLHPEKHVERIMYALPAVVAAYPATRFVIIGEGPAETRLREEADRLGLADAVIFAGAVDREDLGNYIHACDIFVAMSDRTNAANPLFETSLCARPPVVLDTGGTSAAVTDGVTGWLVPEDAPESLADILVRILGDPDRVREVGRCALEWARTHIPTYEYRQAMEVDIVARAAREGRQREGRR